MSDSILKKYCKPNLSDHRKIQLYYAFNPEKINEDYETYGIEFSIGGVSELDALRYDILLRNENFDIIIGEVALEDMDVLTKLNDYQKELKTLLDFYGIHKEVKKLGLISSELSISEEYRKKLNKFEISTYRFNKDKILNKVNSILTSPFIPEKIKMLNENEKNKLDDVKIKRASNFNE